MAKKAQKSKPKSSETRAASIAAFQAARTPEERSESARKAAATRAANRAAGAPTAKAGPGPARFVFTRLDGTKVRGLTRTEKERREKLQAASAARAGLVRVETTRGVRYLPPEQAARRVAAAERARAQAVRRRGPPPQPQPPPTALPEPWNALVTYIRGGRAAGTFETFATDVTDAAEEEAALAGRDPYGEPWFLVISAETEAGAAVYTATIDGQTRQDRIRQIRGAAITAYKRADPAEYAQDYTPQTRRGAAPSKPADKEAQRIQEETRRKFEADSDAAEPTREVRIEAQVASIEAREEYVSEGWEIDDFEDAPF
jgi:hypothetical protein